MASAPPSVADKLIPNLSKNSRLQVAIRINPQRPQPLRQSLGPRPFLIGPRPLLLGSRLSLLGPRPFSYQPYVELFNSRTRPAFDELGAARTLAQMIVDGILQRERTARIVQFSARGTSPLTLGETIDALAASWKTAGTESAKMAALRRVSQRAVADRLLTLAADKDGAPEVRGIVELKMSELRRRARTLSAVGTEGERAHWTSVAADFNRWLERQELPTPSPALRPPPGDPFGMDW